MEDKKTSLTPKTRVSGCAITALFTTLGAIIGLAGFMISPTFSEILNTPGALILLLPAAILVVLVGAVGGALIGVLIALVLRLRSRKTPQTK